MLRKILATLIGVVGLQTGLTSGQDEIGNPAKLELEGDIASQLVAGVDRFLLKEIDKVVAARAGRWKAEYDATGDSKKFFDTKRERFKKILGIRDSRSSFESPELVTTLATPSLVAKTFKFEVHSIRIPVLDGITLEGLLLRPIDARPTGNVIVIPDADQTPEALVGMTGGLPKHEQVARMLANQGNQVVVPQLISREMRKRNGRANLTHREYLYRSAFELGRHIIGYEIQKTLAVVDWYEKSFPDVQTGVWGIGEGGMLALYAAAIDQRIDKVAVEGFLGGRQRNWHYPISRNVFGLLNDFGDAEVMAMITPRPLIHLPHPTAATIKLPSEGGAPAELKPATAKDLEKVNRAYKQLVGDLKIETAAFYRFPNRDQDLGKAVSVFATNLTSEALQKQQIDSIVDKTKGQGILVQVLANTDVKQRMERQVEEIDRFNQALLAKSETVRKEFFAGLDTSSLDKYQATVEGYREKFATEVIGRFDLPLKKFNPRARVFCNEEKYVGYEVVLDVFDDVIAYGIVLVPKGMKPGERRPVVVCQHGLEGRPQDIVQGNHRAYHDFAAKLADEGFITFSPQNLYIFGDRFRTLQRKANTIGKTLFSVIVPQHQQIVNWLKTLPNVDPDRIAFYGLSYGGKSAMRIPPLVPDYCLSICSADFNEWVWKNASTSSRYSYVWTGEYEIFEFDLGSTFNYAEMAALIAPRPFMVERGHFDGVSSDERVAYEFAKVRHLYQAKLKIGERCEIEFFDGPHTINGKGTFQFLRKHLNWPAK